MIPESEWIWMGHAAHFIGAGECLFQLATRVGDFIISSVGDWRPKGNQTPCEPLGLERWSFYETYVFPASDYEQPCGCWDLGSLAEIEGKRFKTGREAQDAHRTMCYKYAALSAADVE